MPKRQDEREESKLKKKLKRFERRLEVFEQRRSRKKRRILSDFSDNDTVYDNKVITMATEVYGLVRKVIAPEEEERKLETYQKCIDHQKTQLREKDVNTITEKIDRGVLTDPVWTWKKRLERIQREDLLVIEEHKENETLCSGPRLDADILYLLDIDSTSKATTRHPLQKELALQWGKCWIFLRRIVLSSLRNINHSGLVLFWEFPN
ncbi:hypothetical protein ILUMI_03549 [Ignelater luminosus]|uniref:Uncharacterized protein n=1 Tax=Ignelater luminosus TaxID=2038154 RepID=A0A8K0DBC0_IGNLU|nr:hypothetical protein ILUMI_03549 [Ignelater luminosus]